MPGSPLDVDAFVVAEWSAVSANDVGDYAGIGPSLILSSSFASVDYGYVGSVHCASMVEGALGRTATSCCGVIVAREVREGADVDGAVKDLSDYHSKGVATMPSYEHVVGSCNSVFGRICPCA